MGFSFVDGRVATCCGFLLSRRLSEGFPIRVQLCEQADKDARRPHLAGHQFADLTNSVFSTVQHLYRPLEARDRSCQPALVHEWRHIVRCRLRQRWQQLTRHRIVQWLYASGFHCRKRLVRERRRHERRADIVSRRRFVHHQYQLSLLSHSVVDWLVGCVCCLLLVQ